MTANMPALTAIILFHEYIAKTFIPYYNIKVEALEASNHLVRILQDIMAQEELNRSGMLSLQWNPNRESIKCEINVLCSVKLENKDGEIYLVIQDGNSRIRMRKDTFNILNIRKVLCI